MTNNENTDGNQNFPWGPDTPQAPPAPPAGARPTSPQPPSFGGAIGGQPPLPPGAGAETVVSSSMPPAGNPVLSGQYGITQPPNAPEPVKTSSKLPWIAAMLGALVLLGGGGFFALTAFGATGGADTPEEAVDALFAALGNEDFITIGELLEPSERRTIVEPTLTELLPELTRLGVLDESVDAGDVEGIDWEFTDLTYRVETLARNSDMVHVYLTGGEVVTEFNSVEFPFSDALREEFGDELAEDDGRTVDQIEETETPLTFVQRDGRWYFSGWFTVAEAARLEAGERLPRESESPLALGSSSPEAAVEAMFAEMVEMDLEGLIGRMDPDEMAVLYRYSPLFLDDAQSLLDELEDEMRAENISWDISDFAFDVETEGDDAVVTMRSFTVDVTSPDIDVSFTYGPAQLRGRVLADELGGRGSFEATTTAWSFEGVVDGEPFSGEIMIDPDAYVISGSGEGAGERVEGEIAIDVDGVCSRYTITAADETMTGCLEDEFSDEDEAVFGFYEGAFADWPTEFPGISMTARRTDGEWYVSPIGTVFNGYVEVLKGLDEEQLDDLIASLDELDSLDAANAFEDAMGDALGESSTSSSDDLEDLFADIVDDADVIDAGPSNNGPVVESNIALTVDRGATARFEDSLSVGAYDSATIDLEAGDTIVITVEAAESSELDATVTLTLDATGAIAGFNDDADIEANLAGLFDSQLEVQVTETGTYVIEIASYDYLSEGGYALTVERS